MREDPHPEGDYPAEAEEAARLAHEEGEAPVYRAGLALADAALPGLAAMTDLFRVRAAQAFADDVEVLAGARRFVDAMQADARLVGLYLQAEDTATLTADREKRRVLAEIVAAAVLDDALIEEAPLVLAVVRVLEAPHVRTLEAIRRGVGPAVAGRRAGGATRAEAARAEVA